MYSVEIHSNVYRQWSVYYDWRECNERIFSRYCMDRYPEVLGMKYDGTDASMVATFEFEFESEEACTWFLLQQ